MQDPFLQDPVRSFKEILKGPSPYADLKDR